MEHVYNFLLRCEEYSYRYRWVTCDEFRDLSMPKFQWDHPVLPSVSSKEVDRSVSISSDPHEVRHLSSWLYLPADSIAEDRLMSTVDLTKIIGCRTHRIFEASLHHTSICH